MEVPKLKEFREKFGMSREQQAELLKITLDTLNNWEYRFNQIPNVRVRFVERVFKKYEEDFENMPEEVVEKKGKIIFEEESEDIFSRDAIKNMSLENKMDIIIEQNISLNEKLVNLSTGFSKVYFEELTK